MKIIDRIYHRFYGIPRAICPAASARNSMENNPAWKGGISRFPYRYKLRSIAKYPEKHAARQAVQSAISSGLLMRGPCKVCGKEKEIHGHHKDYSRPLDVVWLCARHHRMAHGAKK